MASRIFARSLKNINSIARFSGFKTTSIINPLKFKNSFAVSSRNFAATTVSFQQQNTLKELASFLDQEIKLEKETRKEGNILPKVSGFDVKTEGPNVVLTRAFNKES